MTPRFRLARPAADLRRFFKTPKGILLLILAGLTIVASTGEQWAVIGPGLANAMLTAGVIDAAILRYRGMAWEFPSGAILTGLIIAMLLSPQEPWYAVSATSAVAILGKYMFRTRLANVFNPAAFAIVATFYVFDTGQDWWGALSEITPYALVVLIGAGVFMTDRVKKMPMVLTFLGTYFAFFTAAAYVSEPRHVAEIFRPPDLQAALYFAFFILTDPPTSPTKSRDQVICGVIVAVVGCLIFEWVGAAYYLLAGVLVGNIWEAWRRGRGLVFVARPKRRTISSAAF